MQLTQFLLINSQLTRCLIAEQVHKEVKMIYTPTTRVKKGKPVPYALDLLFL